MDTMQTFYMKTDNLFHLHDTIPNREGELTLQFIHSSEKISIAYCHLADRLHIFTHGTFENMDKWIKLHNSVSPYQANLKIFDQATPVEVINRAIYEPEFLLTLL